LKRQEKILTLIDSDGGDGFAAQTVFNVVSLVRDKTIAVVTGHAFSGALLLLQAFGERVAFSNALLQFHNAALFSSEDKELNFEDSAKLGDFLKKSRDIDVEIYSRRTGAPKAKILNLLKTNRLLLAREALELNLIDKVIDPFSSTAEFGPPRRRAAKS
jgi:ATP-dependent protease ClpP protease subunit